VRLQRLAMTSPRRVAALSRFSGDSVAQLRDYFTVPLSVTVERVPL